MRAMDRVSLLYDRECAFCCWSASVLLAWDRRGRLRPVALQSAEAGRLLAGTPEHQRMASWHLVVTNNRVLSAGAAIAPILRLLPGGRPTPALPALSPTLAH